MQALKSKGLKLSPISHRAGGAGRASIVLQILIREGSTAPPLRVEGGKVSQSSILALSG